MKSYEPVAVKREVEAVRTVGRLQGRRPQGPPQGGGRPS